jgi:hypothetical protein
MNEWFKLFNFAMWILINSCILVLALDFEHHREYKAFIIAMITFILSMSAWISTVATYMPS